MHEEIYVARASMVINSKQIRVLGGEVISVNDIMLSQNMVNTYKEILLSYNVLDKVNKDLNTNMSPSDMRRWITVSSPGDTEVIYVLVEHENPEIAASIANSMMGVAPEVISQTVEVGSINVLDYAKVPEKPREANKKLNLSLGVVLGLGMGAGIVFLINFLTPKIKSSKDIEEVLRLNVLGEIIHSDNAKSKMPLITDEKIEKYFIESFKIIALNISNICSKSNYKKILITSTGEKEGKTTVARNLGMTIAATGKSVLLVDCDFYKYNFIRISELGKKCLINVLKNECDYNDVLIKDEKTGLHILPSKGGHEENTDLLNSPQMASLLNNLEEEYDLIIMDTPPSFFISDAVYLSKLADGVVFVIKQEGQTTENIISTEKSLLSADANIIGCILSDIRFMRAESKYNYKYKFDYKSYSA
jgi:capsular exopolysaccharide synthesis family protein